MTSSILMALSRQMVGSLLDTVTRGVCGACGRGVQRAAEHTGYHSTGKLWEEAITIVFNNV